MGSTYRAALTKEEALHLNRWQLFDRAQQEQRRWDRRRNGRYRPTMGAREAECEFRELCDTYLGVDAEAADLTMALVEARSQASVAYLNSRVDGTRPRQPYRVQLSRRAGFRLPYGVKSVARPTPYGNPFVVGEDGNGNRDDSVWRFEAHLVRRNAYPLLNAMFPYPSDDELRAALTGWDLACWCPITGEPGMHCHADVLLRFVNHGYWPDPAEPSATDSR